MVRRWFVALGWLLSLSWSLLGCSSAPHTADISAVAVAAAPTRTIAPIPSPTPLPTQPLPSVSLYDVLGNEIGYPADNQAQIVSAYPAPAVASSGGGLPAPVISIPHTPTSAPPTPTSLPTVPAPTATAAAVADEPALPTMTPPALPRTSAEEHYWFRRPVAEGGVVWTDKHYPYGSTRGGTLRPHHGVEFNVGYNTPILSVASGTVVFAGADSIEVIGPEANFYGRAVVIQHDMLWQEQPIFSLYGHLNEVYVTVGQTVQSQAVIGLSGATGVADGPHMHFEVRVGQNSYAHTRNPILWLYPFPDRGTIVGRVTFADGTLAENAPISLRRLDGGVAPHMSTTSYVGNTVNGDERWQENFAFDDVYAGYYEVTVRDGEKKFSQEVWVSVYQTSFVELVLDR